MLGWVLSGVRSSSTHRNSDNQCEQFARLLWYKIFLQNIKLKGLNLKLNTCIHFLAPSKVTNLSTLPCIGVCASRLGVVMVATLHEEHVHGWTWFQPQCWSPTSPLANHPTQLTRHQTLVQFAGFLWSTNQWASFANIGEDEILRKNLVMIFRDRHCQSSTPKFYYQSCMHSMPFLRYYRKLFLLFQFQDIPRL